MAAAASLLRHSLLPAPCRRGTVIIMASAFARALGLISYALQLYVTGVVMSPLVVYRLLVSGAAASVGYFSLFTSSFLRCTPHLQALLQKAARLFFGCADFPQQRRRLHLFLLLIRRLLHAYPSLISRFKQKRAMTM